MKTFILLIIFIGVSFLTLSQSKRELANEAMNKLEGKWVGLANGDSFTIYLLQNIGRVEKLIPFAIDTVAFVFGWYQMTNKHGIIASDLDSMSYDVSSSFSFVGFYTKSLKQIPFGIVDLVHKRSVNAMLSFINDDEAILKTWIGPSCIADLDRGKPKSFPDEIRLTRISRNVLDLITIKNPPEKIQKDLFCLNTD